MMELRENTKKQRMIFSQALNEAAVRHTVQKPTADRTQHMEAWCGDLLAYLPLEVNPDHRHATHMFYY